MIRLNPILSAGLMVVLAAAGAIVGTAAAETPAPSADRDQQIEPRYRLADPVSSSMNRTEQNGERRLTKEDFYWSNLTAGSAASGSDPEIGNRAKHAYYDFRDGFDLPKYIAGPKTEIK